VGDGEDEGDIGYKKMTPGQGARGRMRNYLFPPCLPHPPCVSIKKIYSVEVIPLAHWTRMLLV